ncbi:response regulator [Pseudoflavitalea sp. G-6-1-2]|uniref:response regulator n=1 Tax=Pseudoflavitalea sp. G-6-1-2 TaxID=2728841 RepID=UPI00146BD1CE|nr:response regulator [Pseudoflavitalea sp. G-6-1-2]NML22453.1 response regulator [Pseudoflavitalea sp. G-6-1-2]
MPDYKRLLIIDDDYDDSILFMNAVKEVDDTIVCYEARDGRQALEMLNNIDNPLPDFIFLDLRMPGYSGEKCLIEIKNRERLKNIPVIIYTTSKNVEESIQLKAMGACHFMTKPRNSAEIYYMVSIVLEEEWDSFKNKNILQ